jgi:hypothetical protein
MTGKRLPDAKAVAKILEIGQPLLSGEMLVGGKGEGGTPANPGRGRPKKGELDVLKPVPSAKAKPAANPQPPVTTDDDDEGWDF